MDAKVANTNKKYVIDMCSGPIVSRLLMFTGPLILSHILQLLFNAADVIVVGKYAGDNSLAAVGSVGPVTNLMINLFIGISIGANVMASRYYGAGDEKRFKLTTHTSTFVSLIGGVVLAVIGFTSAKQILTWMSSPPEVIDLATLYLRIYFLGMPAQLLYNFGSAILRAVGDTKRPMYYLTFAGVINVILNLIFVIFMHMDVAGVALATIISQTISAMLIMRCLIREEGMLKLNFRELKVDRPTLIRIIQIGLPASLQGMTFSLSNIIIQASVNSFGATIVAGNSAAQNLEGFVYVAMNSFYQACLSFVSQNVGARKFERINKITVRAVICVTITGLVLGNLGYIFGYGLLNLYTDSRAVMDAGMVRMLYILCPYCLCGMMDVMVGAIRGLGYSIMPMIVSLLGACGLRLFWIFTFFQLPQFHTPQNLYVTYPVSWTITFSTHVICYIIVKKKFDASVRKYTEEYEADYQN